MAYPALRLFIAGQWLDRGTRSGAAVLNPADGTTIGEVPLATPGDIAEALTSASAAFAAWSRTNPFDRATLLQAAATAIRAQREGLARTVTLELGKPLRESLAEVEQAAGMFDWAAQEAMRLNGRVIPGRSPGLHQFTAWEPIGPVAAFSPWNAPLLTPARKLSSTLAAGCSVILKPSEETPASALHLARILDECGLPPGVVQVLFGEPGTLARQVLTSPAVRGLTFTGSTRVGKLLAQQALENVARLVLELGGHAPVIVLDDVDAEAVASAAAAAKFRNAGQICTSPTRFYVQSGAYARFRDAFVAATERIRVGDGFDPAATMGPVVSDPRRAALEEMIADARAHGARLLTGGTRPDRPGFFLAPTVLEDVPDACRAATVEPFGPLALLARFDDDAAALAQANRLPFGLAAYVMGRDMARVHRCVAGLASGNVVVNHWRVSQPETPFGGIGQSGLGLEGAHEGVQAFLNQKFVTMSLSTD